MPIEDWIQHWKAAQFLYDWQNLIAGVFALAAAFFALRAARRKERREAEAMRKSLAVEIRRLVDILRQTHQAFIVAVQNDLSLTVCDVEKQTARGVPVVYPATADQVGLLGHVAPYVVTFYANLRDIEFAGRMSGGAAAAPRHVSPTALRDLADLIDKACQSALPLLS